MRGFPLAKRGVLCRAALLGLLSASAAEAQSVEPGDGQPETIVVTGVQHFVTSRVDPALGVTSYTADQAQIANVPGGDGAAFQQVLLRLPGVVQDSYGEIHIRGEHGNTGYRIDGVTLPEGLEGFGQQFDSHFIQSATLLTGALPAQYGLRLSGVVDITTKSGADLDGGEVGVYGGSFGTVRPYVDFGGSTGKLDYFVSFSDLHNDLGIENPTSSTAALHDRTDQLKGFGSLSYRFDDEDKLTLIWGASYGDFQIPDTPGVAPRFTLAGVAPIPSSQLNENQNEQDYFAVLAYQLTRGDLSVQTSLFYHYDGIRFVPDAVGDLEYQGVAGRTNNILQSGGSQVDATYTLNDRHTLRFGGIVSVEAYDRHDETSLFAASTTGAQLSDVPFTITDADRQGGLLLGLYAQDEWRLTPRLTINYGARYDVSQGFTDASQLSPRINAVYQLDDETTLHLGYARTFTPPGIEFISAANVAKFAGTTNAPTVHTQDPPYPERANYFDVGALWKPTSALSLTLDGFYKASNGGIDLGQFGDAVILTPFNYSHGHTYGAEAGVNYSLGSWQTGLNVSWVRATAVGITSAQSEFPAAELAYIDRHWIVLDHDQPYTISLDSSYVFDDGNTRLFSDFLFGSGLRYGFANFGTLDPHYQLNLGIEHTIPVDRSDVRAIKLRFDLTNLFDQRAELRAGSGVGIAEPQYLPPRGFFGTAAFEF